MAGLARTPWIAALFLICIQPTAIGAGPNVDNTCNIRRVFADEQFQAGLLNTKHFSEPIVFVTSQDRQSKLIELASEHNLLKNFGSSEVKLSSSNTYSRDTTLSSLKEYLSTFNTSASGMLANESFYLFGGNEGPWVQLSAEAYVLPGCKFCKEAGAITPGIGNRMSGVSFHFHGPGFSEVIYGAKRWFLYPPPVDGSSSDSSSVSLAPGFHPDMSVSQWVDQVYPMLDVKFKPFECTIRRGDVLYFPDRWMHATLNTEAYNFFISVFLDEQLMR
jgi:hypothetical protein